MPTDVPSAFQVFQEAYYVVYEKNLMELFKLCRECASPVELLQTVIGSAVVIKTTCHMGHEFVWESQPRLPVLLEIRLYQPPLF